MGAQSKDKKKFHCEINRMDFPSPSPRTAEEKRLLGEPSSVEIEARACATSKRSNGSL
jgi:hypothetical protein